MSPSNLIRQAGTVFALAAYYRHTRDARLAEPIQRTLSALGRHSLPKSKSPMQSWIERTHVLSLPFARWKVQTTLERFGWLYAPEGDGRVLSPDAGYANALAGTGAIALLAELTYSQATGDNRFADLRSAWLRGLLSLRIPRRRLQTDADVDRRIGLLQRRGVARDSRLCGPPSRRRVGRCLADLDGSLMEKYAQKADSGFYHWGALAAAQRHATTRDPPFVEFLRTQADLFFRQIQGRHNPAKNPCADMEGLAATLGVLERVGEGHSERGRRIRGWLSMEAAKFARLQIQPAQIGMALGGNAKLSAPRMAEFPGAFLLGVYEPSTRVDAAQHCIAAAMIIDRERLELPPTDGR